MDFSPPPEGPSSTVSKRLADAPSDAPYLTARDVHRLAVDPKSSARAAKGPYAAWASGQELHNPATASAFPATANALAVTANASPANERSAIGTGEWNFLLPL